MVRVKLCGVRTVADALLCAQAGADEVGVIFAPKSRRKVTIAEAKAIRDALPPRLPLIGVFLDAPIDEIERTAEEVGLQAAQLHGAWRSGATVPLCAALQVTGPQSLQARPGAFRLLLDGPSGGSGKSFAWELAAKAREIHQGELFIAGGLTAENVAEAIAVALPDGVDVASGIEGPDGFKDEGRVRAFVRAARSCG